MQRQRNAAAGDSHVASARLSSEDAGDHIRSSVEDRDIVASYASDFVPSRESTPPEPSSHTAIHMPENEEEDPEEPFIGLGLFNLLDVRRYFRPMTQRRLMFWLIYLGVAGGLFGLEHFFDIFEHFYDFILNNGNGAFAFLVNGLDPLVLFLGLMTSNYYKPDRLAELQNKYPEHTEFKRERVFDPYSEVKLNLGVAYANRETAYVIPSYNPTDKELKRLDKVIRAALKVFKPNQIFIIDNINKKRADGPAAHVVAQFEGVNYKFIPIGNKSAAQYFGAFWAKQLGFKYLLTTDDDVFLPEDMIMPTHMIKGLVKAVCIGIRAISGRKKPGFWQRLFTSYQNLEYLFSDMTKMRETCVDSNGGGCFAPHGAVSFWDIVIFVEVMKRHNLRFHGEDMQMGILLWRMGYEIAYDWEGQTVDTVCPQTLESLIMQRAKSWGPAQKTKLPSLILYTITAHKSPIYGMHNLNSLLTKGYLTISDLVDYIRLLVYLAKYNQWGFWQWTIILQSINMAGALIFNYWKVKDRPEFRSPWYVVLTNPLYKYFQQGVSLLSIWYTFAEFLPGSPSTRRIEEVIDQTPELKAVNEWIKAMPPPPTAPRRRALSVPEMREDDPDVGDWDDASDLGAYDTDSREYRPVRPISSRRMPPPLVSSFSDFREPSKISSEGSQGQESYMNAQVAPSEQAPQARRMKPTETFLNRRRSSPALVTPTKMQMPPSSNHNPLSTIPEQPPYQAKRMTPAELLLRSRRVSSPALVTPKRQVPPPGSSGASDSSDDSARLPGTRPSRWI